MSRLVHRHYESVQSMIDTAFEVPEDRSKRIETFPEHARCSGWDQVYKKTQRPWKEGVSPLQGMRNKVQARLTVPSTVRRRKRWRDDTGDEVCPDRLRSGQAYWQGVSSVQKAGPKQVTILSNISVNCHIKTDTILWRGVTALVLADLLEQAGYRVQIVGYAMAAGQYSTTGKRGGTCCWDGLQTYVIKGYRSPLDSTTLVGSIAGWFFRTVIFRLIHQEDDKKVSAGMGSARDMPLGKQAEQADGSILVNIQNALGESAAVKFLKQQLERFD